MKNDEIEALSDFDDWTQNPTVDMQEFINVHKGYCRYVAIDSHVTYLYLLLHDFYDATSDDQCKFLNKMYENRDLMMEED
jgi:hypothetical protein